jgi:hypothetical protein
MLDERELALKPIVGESVGHNARVSSPPGSLASQTETQPCCMTLQPEPHRKNLEVLPLTIITTQTVSNIRALTASLFGVAAGTLGLESLPGFFFYFIGTAVVSLLVFSLKAKSDAGAYFFRPVGDFWIGDLFGGLMSFVLTWTLFYGLCNA